MPAFCFDGNPGEDSEDMSQVGPSPSILLSDDTASAKDLLIKVDADKAQLRDNAGADGSLLVLDLANSRVGVATASPTVALDVTGAAAISSTLAVTGVATLSANPVVTNTAPGMAFTDTTGSAKSLTIAIDSNLAQLRESAGAAGSLLVLDLANNRVGVATASPTVALDVTGAALISSTLGVTGVATFSANPIITNTAPSLALTDTTGSAKSLTIAVDSDKAQLRESAGAAGSLLVLDLTNNRVGVATASPTVALDVTGAATISSTTTVGSLTVGGGTNISTIASGSFTPTGTALVNVASVTPNIAYYLRIGTRVIVWGSVTIDPTAAGEADTQASLSLPIASNFATSEDAAGTISTGSTEYGGVIFADAANDYVIANYPARSTDARVFRYMYGYTII